MKISKRQLKRIIKEEKARLVEYSDYPSYGDVADAMDDITDMLEGVSLKYVESGWLEQGDHASLSADLMRLFEQADQLRGAFDGLAQAMGDR